MSQQWTPPASPAPGGGAPPNFILYLILGIVATIFCCLPGGVVSIIYAVQVNSKHQAGDTVGSQEAAKKAKMWLMISVGAGLVVWILIILLNVFGVMMSSSF